MRTVLFPGALFAGFPEPAAAARLQAEAPRRFSTEEQALIRDHFTASSTKVRRFDGEQAPTPGEALSPGTPKRLLPAELEARLPELDPEFERVIVDGRVLLIDVATETVHDVVPGLRVG